MALHQMSHTNPYIYIYLFLYRDEIERILIPSIGSYSILNDVLKSFITKVLNILHFAKSTLAMYIFNVPTKVLINQIEMII